MTLQYALLFIFVHQNESRAMLWICWVQCLCIWRRIEQDRERHWLDGRWDSPTNMRVGIRPIFRLRSLGQSKRSAYGVGVTWYELVRMPLMKWRKIKQQLPIFGSSRLLLSSSTFPLLDPDLPPSTVNKNSFLFMTCSEYWGPLKSSKQNEEYNK